MRWLFIVVLTVLLVSCSNELAVSACVDALLDFDAQKSDAACDVLSHADQEKAAKIASEKSGVIVFMPAYQAKAVRDGREP